MNNKVFEIVNQQIFKKLEEGIIPWKMPWYKNSKPACNYISKKPYRGINSIILNMQGFRYQYFLTFNQVKKLGGCIKKGEHSLPVIFWKYIEKSDESCDEKKVLPLLRYYRVFNIEQCDGINMDEIEKECFSREFKPIVKAQKIVDEMPNRPKIQHIQAYAYYRPSTDTVNMPPKNLFFSDEEYFSTLYHELSHATGHRSRLNRDFTKAITSMNRSEYSKEELIAEFCASYLTAEAGIEGETIDNSAAYIQNWLKVLKNNKTWLVFAAAKAQKAADYILGMNQESK